MVVSVSRIERGEIRRRSSTQLWLFVALNRRRMRAEETGKSPDGELSEEEKKASALGVS
jgi:hypothetical protein